MANIHNPHFDQIVVFLDGVSEQSNCVHFLQDMRDLDVNMGLHKLEDEDSIAKVTCVNVEGNQPPYYQMFMYAVSDEVLGDVVVMSNADQAFDYSVAAVHNLNPDVLAVLSTRGFSMNNMPQITSYFYRTVAGTEYLHNSGIGHIIGVNMCNGNPYSWDTFIFHKKTLKGRLKEGAFRRQNTKNENVYFFMNEMGAENAALWALEQSFPFKSIWNACDMIHSWDFHLAPKMHKARESSWKKVRRSPGGSVPYPWGGVKRGKGHPAPSKHPQCIAKRNCFLEQEQEETLTAGTANDSSSRMTINRGLGGYNNLSCPFEWYKYSCSYMHSHDGQESEGIVAKAATEYYQHHLNEMKEIFDRLFTSSQQQGSSVRILMSGDSLLRQIFVSLACNAHSLYSEEQKIIDQAEIPWRDTWPCPGILKNCSIRGGQHGGFDSASIRFTNGSEIHFVPHGGFLDAFKSEPEVVQRMIHQVRTMGTIDFGTKTALLPSGPMDVFVYNAGIHKPMASSEHLLKLFVTEITTPIMKNREERQRPKFVYVATPSQHFNTVDGQWRQHVMTDKDIKCVDSLPSNPRAELEKKILIPGLNVDAVVDGNDLELGGLHVQLGDCSHYCMPGVPDTTAAKLVGALLQL